MTKEIGNVWCTLDCMDFSDLHILAIERTVDMIHRAAKFIKFYTNDADICTRQK